MEMIVAVRSALLIYQIAIAFCVIGVASWSTRRNANLEDVVLRVLGSDNLCEERRPHYKKLAPMTRLPPLEALLSQLIDWVSARAEGHESLRRLSMY